MKIAFLTSEYPHPITGCSGGIGTSIKALAKALITEGHHVRVIVYGQTIDAVFLEDEIVIQQIKNVKLKGLSWWLTRKKLEKIINQLYDNKEIEVIEAPDWTGITSFIQPKKCPIVIRLHGSDTYFCHLDQRPVKWINKFHEKRALQNAHGLLSVSQFTADLTNLVFGLKKSIAIIHNGIDVNSFEPLKYKKSIKSLIVGKKKEVVLLYFGTLIRKKGVLELPHIFNKVVEQVPEALLYLVGKDADDISTGNKSTWQMMQSLFSEKAIKNIHYKGSVPYDEMIDYLQKATVCVFPTFAEALPVSWLEAMAMEKAIVASNIGWAHEMIEEGKEGFLVHPTQHDKFASRIVELLNNPILRERLGGNARIKVIKNFSAEIVAKHSVKYYNSI